METMFAMPWKEGRIVDERVKFVAEVLKGERKIKKLCQQYGISRKTVSAVTQNRPMMVT
jgi:hypothetical protein